MAQRLRQVAGQHDRAVVVVGAPARRFGAQGIELWVKDESGNPTGSFKARGLSLAVNRARELGAPGVQLASAGNAALAITAYAAAAGLPARVALPEDTPRTVFEANERWNSRPT